MLQKCWLQDEWLTSFFFSVGPDSPTSPIKDLTTHTRALKLKHQCLEERLELCLLELRKLCIREAVSEFEYSHNIQENNNNNIQNITFFWFFKFTSIFVFSFRSWLVNCPLTTPWCLMNSHLGSEEGSELLLSWMKGWSMWINRYKLLSL